MADTDALPWSLAAASVHREPRTFAFSATPEQCAAFANALDIHAVHHLDVDGTATRVSTHRIEVALSLQADISQLSVVSLEPVRERIARSEHQLYDETLDPQAVSDAEMDDEDGALEEAALESGLIPLGALVQELVAVALDPYPRAPEEAWRDHIEDDGTEDDAKPSPFAILGTLKSGSD